MKKMLIKYLPLFFVLIFPNISEFIFNISLDINYYLYI